MCVRIGLSTYTAFQNGWKGKARYRSSRRLALGQDMASDEGQNDRDLLHVRFSDVSQVKMGDFPLEDAKDSIAMMPGLRCHIRHLRCL